MPGKPPRPGAVGAAANRDGSRSDPELDAAVFTVLMAGRANGLSVLAGLAGPNPSLPQSNKGAYPNGSAKARNIVPSSGGVATGRILTLSPADDSSALSS